MIWSISDVQLLLMMTAVMKMGMLIIDNDDDSDDDESPGYGSRQACLCFFKRNPKGMTLY